MVIPKDHAVLQQNKRRKALNNKFDVFYKYVRIRSAILIGGAISIMNCSNNAATWKKEEL
jgi:hypothetical protein